MTKQIVYGAIEDSIFLDIMPVDLEDDSSCGLGHLDVNLLTFFKKKGTLNDDREDRLTVLSKALTSKLSIIFDSAKLTKPSVLKNMSNNHGISLFNICERIFLANTVNKQQVENALVSNSTEFGIYVPESLVWSQTATKTTVQPIMWFYVAVEIRDWISFQVNMGGDIVEFKLWLNSKAFKQGYPLSTISKVYLPTEPRNLLNIGNISSIIDAVKESSGYVWKSMHQEVEDTNHSGIKEYFTKYVISSTSFEELPFGIIYLGAAPSSLEIREAIRDKLIASGTATEERWKELFPDLFVVAEFYLVPLWKHVVKDRVNGELFPSIISTKNLTDPIKRLFINTANSWIVDKTELLLNSRNEAFILSLPDLLNLPEFLSILDMFPTYQNHSNTSPAAQYMTVEAKEFNSKLARAISILEGDSPSGLTEFIENVRDNKRYLSFICKSAEFHVLFKESYPEDTGG